MNKQPHEKPAPKAHHLLIFPATENSPEVRYEVEPTEDDPIIQIGQGDYRRDFDAPDMTDAEAALSRGVMIVALAAAVLCFVVIVVTS